MTRDDSTTDDRRRTATAGTAAPKTGRRTFLAALGAGATFPTLAAAQSSTNSEFVEFVETDGGNFVVAGEPVYFNGSNNFWLTDSSAGTQDRIDRIFEHFEAMGIDLVRMWANGAGEERLQPSPGEHDERQLQIHDYAVAAAREHGIRLILSLVDNWDHEGGMLKYADWTGGDSRAHFYENEEARELYQNHVETIVTRTNTVTGLEYREDPTIAMWELANEPRLEADSSGLEEDQSTVRSEGIHREILGNWIQDMSAYVKELDSNHLVSTGSEGHFYGAADAGYPDDDWDGQDFVEHHSYDTIDAASFHWYPDHWELPLDRGSDWIRNHVQTAREELGKPVYLGEFNVNVDNGLSTRQQHLESWYDTADEVDIDGMAIWQVVLPETNDHDGFQIYREDSGYVVEDYADVVAEKSGGSDSPLADAVTPGSLRVGETGDFTGSYSLGASGSVTDYEWSFEGGAGAAGERVQRSFDEPGDVEVELTVTDEAGNAASDTEVVSVEALPEGSFLLEGAGQQVFEDVEEFHFASTERSGDFVVEARVATVASTSPTAQAGILAVDDPDAADALGGVAVTPGNGTEQVRSYDASSPVWLERTDDDRTPPLWLRLEREGGYVYSSVSEDGESWTQIQEGQVAFDDAVRLGLFVSSNSPGELCAAQFDEASWLEDWTATDVGDVDVAGSTTSGGAAPPEPPAAPASPSGVTTDATASTIELGWEAVSNADHYNVSRDGTQVAEPPSTTYTFTGLSPDTTYTIGLEAENDAGTSTTQTVEVTTEPDVPCEGADGGSDEVDGQTVCDVNDDGYYRDVTGDGSVGQGDVAEFFTKQHRSAWKQPDMFDFSENGAVTHGDVVELFDYVALQ